MRKATLLLAIAAAVAVAVFFFFTLPKTFCRSTDQAGPKIADRMTIAGCP